MEGDRMSDKERTCEVIKCDRHKMAEVIINVENLTLKREPWRSGWVEAAGIVSHHGFVVRCRDCKHYVSQSIHGSYCKKTIGSSGEPDGFCKWGERK